PFTRDGVCETIGTLSVPGDRRTHPRGQTAHAHPIPPAARRRGVRGPRPPVRRVPRLPDGAVRPAPAARRGLRPPRPRPPDRLLARRGVPVRPPAGTRRVPRRGRRPRGVDPTGGEPVARFVVANRAD